VHYAAAPQRHADEVKCTVTVMRDNIDDSELVAFRKLAKTYEGLGGQQLERLLKDGDFMEICHDR
jgi:hypothetical protein